MSIRDRVVEFVAARILVDPESLAESCCFYDLGIDGDDATELLASFAQHFQVDMRGFMPRSYYGPEASWIPFFGGKRPEKALTIGMLIKAAENRKWTE